MQAPFGSFKCERLSGASAFWPTRLPPHLLSSPTPPRPRLWLWLAPRSFFCLGGQGAQVPPKGLHLDCSLAPLQKEEPSCHGALCCLSDPKAWDADFSAVLSGLRHRGFKTMLLGLIWHSPLQECNLHLAKFNEERGEREGKRKRKERERESPAH